MVFKWICIFAIVSVIYLDAIPFVKMVCLYVSYGITHVVDEDNAKVKFIISGRPSVTVDDVTYHGPWALWKLYDQIKEIVNKER